ncbi:MAG: hypothetical protein J5791_01600 [Fibrobacter sp.]|nr:hypothetical protein [Fibrobacter sp.]
MPNEELGNEEKKTIVGEEQQQQHINALNFLQSQIAKYYGNDGILSSKEKEELEKLYGTLGIKKDQYDRLVEIAKDEIRNFKKFDVVSYLLEREDKMKLYSDAERLSIRISRVERWISELEDIVNPPDDEPTNKNEILIDKMNKIIKWYDQEMFVETNIDKDLKENEKNNESNDEMVKNEISDFINEEKNLDWRFYCKQILLKKLNDETADVSLEPDLNEIYETIRKGIHDGTLNRVWQYKDLDDALDDENIDVTISVGKMPIKKAFVKAVASYTDNANIEKSLSVEEKKRLGEIRSRIRQYSDLKKLFRKKGYTESKTEVDFEKHWGGCLSYVLVVLLVLYVVDTYFFETLDLIHKIVKSEETLVDSRDSTEYKTVEIDGVRWMAYNLNYDTKDSNSVESKLPKNGGRFYSWDHAINVCPTGWRLPTLTEWKKMVAVFGGDSSAIMNLKSRSWGGVDSVGFSALPAGRYNAQTHAIKDSDKGASWWTYTMENERKIFVVGFGTEKNEINFHSENNGSFHSVRCVKIKENGVPYIPYPQDLEWEKKTYLNGKVVGFKGENVPIIRLNGKPTVFYDSSMFVDANKGKDEKLVFPADASVEGIRIDEIVYKKSGGDWIKDALWRMDSVKVSQRCLVVDLETKQDTICNVTYRTLVGADSVLAKTSWSHSCETLSEGDIYQFDFHYIVYRKQECKDDCSAVNAALSYKLDRTEIYDK